MIDCIWRIRLAFRSCRRWGGRSSASASSRSSRCGPRPSSTRPPASRTASGRLSPTATGRWRPPRADASDSSPSRPYFGGDGTMSLRVFDDQVAPGGSVEVESTSATARGASSRWNWSIARAEILQEGPERAVLWTRWQGRNSWTGDLQAAAQQPSVHVAGRTLAERARQAPEAGLPLPATRTCRCPLRASAAAEGQPADEPVAHARGFAFVSDVLGSVDLPEEVRVTVCRASLRSKEQAGDVMPWLPAADCGELKYQFLLTTQGHLEHLAEELLHPRPFMCRRMTTPAAGGLLRPAHAGLRHAAGRAPEREVHADRARAERSRQDGGGRPRA